MEFKMAKEERDTIIQAYGKVLAPSSANQSFAFARRESDLPFPKAIIRQAITQALLDGPEEQYRKGLEVAYEGLEFFVPDEEYTQFVTYHNIASRVVEGNLNVRDALEEMKRLIDSKDYLPDLHSATWEKIKERMAKRVQELQTLRSIVKEVRKEDDDKEIEDGSECLKEGMKAFPLPASVSEQMVFELFVKGGGKGRIQIS